MGNVPHKLKSDIHNIHSLVKECIRKIEVLHDRPHVIYTGTDVQLLEVADLLKIALGKYEDFTIDFDEKYVENIDLSIIEDERNKQRKREESIKKQILENK